MLQRLFHIDTDEEVIDPGSGEPYRHITGNFRGNSIEINEDLTEGRYGKYNAKANNDTSTMGVRMAEDGLIAWFKRTFGG